MRDKAVIEDDLFRGLSSIGGVSTEVLRGTRLGINYSGVKKWAQLSHIVAIGSGYDERQRGATGVDLKMALAPFFSPDQSGWDRLLPVLRVLSWLTHLWIAIPMQSPPSRYIPPSRLSTTRGKSPAHPIHESTGEWLSDCQTFLLGARSTEYLSVRRIQSQKTPAWRAVASCLPPASACTTYPDLFAAAESAARPSPKTDRTLPSTRPSS